MNIYEDYINKIIDDAKAGDRLMFISPSTLFGFYSLGVKNFISVCEKLDQAKGRGAKIRLLIDVHDVFSAKAAEGLLSMLTDGDDVRTSSGPNRSNYSILLRKATGSIGSPAGRFVKFSSGTARTEKFLPAIEIRPFDGVMTDSTFLFEGNGDVPQSLKNLEEEFESTWSSGQLVNPALNNFSSEERQRKALIIFQSLSYLSILALGVLGGVTFAAAELSYFKDNPGKLLLGLLASIVIGLVGGILSTLLSTFFSRRSFLGKR